MPKKIFEREGIAKIKYQDVGNYNVRSAILKAESNELNLVDLIQGDFENKYIKLTIEEYTCEDCEHSINDESGKNVACSASINQEPKWCKYANDYKKLMSNKIKE